MENQGSFKLETHVHTKYSHDSMLPLWLLYIKCKLQKIDYIAITEHNNIIGALRFKEYCDKRGAKVKVIVGEEIMTSGGEIIGLFLHKEIKAGMTPEKTIADICKQNGVVYIPHPYDEKRYKTVLKEEYIKANLQNIDCIECYNGRNVKPSFSEKQEGVAERYGLTKVIGSDAHTIFEVGRNYILVDFAPDNVSAFKDAIKTARFHKSPCLHWCHWITKCDRVMKYILKGDFHALYRAINRKIRRTK